MDLGNQLYTKVGEVRLSPISTIAGETIMQRH